MALRYHLTFIDEVFPVSKNDKRSQVAKLREKADLPTLKQSDTPSNSSASFEQGFQGSEGSLGHPHLCRRPCIKFARGSCDQGAQCGYCHSSHPHRPVTFDKHGRDMLTSPDPEASLDRPFSDPIEKEMELWGAQEILRLIQCELTIRSASSPVRGANEQPMTAVGSVAPPPRKIRQRLELMSFISLVGLVRSYVGGHLATLLLQAVVEMREEAKSYQ
eukprot:g29056.t1